MWIGLNQLKALKAKAVFLKKLFCFKTESQMLFSKLPACWPALASTCFCACQYHKILYEPIPWMNALSLCLPPWLYLCLLVSLSVSLLWISVCLVIKTCHRKWKCSLLSRIRLFATPWIPGSSVHRILQERILEWVAIPFSRGSSQPRY